VSLKAVSVRRIGVALLVVGALLIVLWVVTTYRAATGLIGQLARVEQLSEGGLTAVDPADVGDLVADVRRDVVTLRNNTGWLLPGAARLDWLPRVGPLLRQAPRLLDMADALSEVAVLLWRDVEPALEGYRQGESVQSLVPDVSVALAEDLACKRRLASIAADAHADIAVADLPFRARGPMEKLGKVLPLLSDGLQSVPTIPSLLGYDQPRTYLVLALNEDELRPGGGFISGVGEVRLAAGDVVSMTFRDGYAVDDFTQPYPGAPQPLRDLMGLQLWVFRDSNWSPDFPTAVRDALPLYRPGHPVEVHGVIAVDQWAVQALFGALGPVSLPDADEPLTGEDLVDYMHASWEPDSGEIDVAWWRQRKDFMGEMAQAAIERVKSGDTDFVALGQVALELLDQRHIQVYVNDAALAEVLAGRGWDGRIAPANRDYLMVVEANVGYNKASASIVRSMHYEVDLAVGPPRATVHLLYRNLSQDGAPCSHAPRYDPSYAAMMERCYWAYTRLYTPGGASLLSASDSPIAAEYLDTGRAWPGEAVAAREAIYMVFGQAVLVPRASQRELTFSYALPPEVVTCGADGVCVYSLTIQKQAGIRTLTGSVHLRLTPAAEVLHVLPEPTDASEGTLTFEFASSRDVGIEVQYRTAED